jgi:hypothetical protein
MAAILAIASGTLGLFVALVSLVLGGSLLTAALLWGSVAIAATCLGLAWSLIPHALAARA